MDFFIPPNIKLSQAVMKLIVHVSTQKPWGHWLPWSQWLAMVVGTHFDQDDKLIDVQDNYQYT
jgi:hypothetical protein